MADLTRTKALGVTSKVNADWGENICTVDNVYEVYVTGTLTGKEAVASRILEQLEQVGCWP